MSFAGVKQSWGNERVLSAFAILLWIGVALCLARIATASADYQWDFRVFHKAPAVLAAGGNPYDASQLSLERLSYLYPPLALYVFKPLSWLSFETAYALWFGMKVLALAVLARLWHRHFEPLNTTPLMIGFLAFAFNGAILRDFTAGNITIFEQLGLWSAFLLMIGGRSHLAGAVIALVAQFKLMPIIFLGLLPFVGPARGWRPLATGAIVFGALLGANFVLMPELSGEYASVFFSSNPNIDERGDINPSSLALMRDATEFVAERGIGLPSETGDWLFLAYVTAAAIAVGSAALRYRRALGALDPRLLIYAGCVLYVLTMPRVKDYTYIMLLIPALFVIRRLDPKLAVPLIGVLVLVPAQTSYVPGVGGVLPWLEGYLPLFTAAAIAIQLLRWILRTTSANQGPVDG